MHSDKKGNINDYLSDTIASVFDNVYTVNVKGSTNCELFATDNDEGFNTFTEYLDNADNYELKNLMGNVSENAVKYKKGNYLLTDDKAAVELLGMQVIDELIQEELGYYKQIFKEEGIKGLLFS